MATPNAKDRVCCCFEQKGVKRQLNKDYIHITNGSLDLEVVPLLSNWNEYRSAKTQVSVLEHRPSNPE